MAYRLTQRARLDALHIWMDIAADNQTAADRWMDRLVHHFEMLGRNPYAGRSRDELRPGYRSFPVGQYLIFYRVQRQDVSIMHVLHGRRDLQSLLGSRT